MTTHQDTSTERERFESWYFENVNRAELPDWLPTLKTYSSATVANLWCTWQAALASRDEAAQGDPAHRLRSEISRLRDLLAQVADEPNIDRARAMADAELKRSRHTAKEQGNEN